MSEGSINPNISMTETQTTTNGKIEVNSGGGPLSFDELEQVTAKAKRDKQIKAKESKDEKSIDLTSDTDKGKKAETKSEEKSPPKSEKKLDEAKQEQQNEANLEKARKMIKAKLKDSEFELDEEAAIPVKINGKEELVPVKELMGNYSGKVAWDKKFTELSKKEKDIKGLESKAQMASKSFSDLFNEQDETVRMFKMAQMAGVDPVQYRQKFLNDNIKLLENWYAMSDDERKADALAYEAKYHKYRADTLEQSTKQQQAQREQQAKLAQIRASHQIDEDTFMSFHDQAQQAVKEGILDESYLKPEKVAELVQKDRIWTAVESVLDQVKLPWPQEEQGKRLLKLVEDSYQMGFKPQEVVEFVVETYASPKTKKDLVSQIKEERQEFLSGKKPVQQAKVSKDEVWSFDQM